jgi:hypothetical protein
MTPFTTLSNHTRRKTAAKKNLGKATRKATLMPNEFDCQNQKRRLHLGCYVAFFFSSHCSLGTFHFFLPPFPATGSFNGLHPKSKFLVFN